ncbi:MAG: peroxiredoxin [Synechococcus sp.]
MTAPAPIVPRRVLLQGLAAGGAAALGLGLLGGARPAAALGGTLPELDQPAPDFQLPGVAAGKPVSLGLADFRGRWVVLYFYPRDFTSGCTLEARGFQRDRQAFVAAGAEVVGVSADGEEEHASFCQSEGLGYPLLSDPDGRVSRAYGSWIAPFSQRHTFLIDPQGVLRARWVAVRPAGHSQEVLTALRELQGSSAG